MKTCQNTQLAIDVGEERIVSSDLRKLEDAGMEGWELVPMAPITIPIDGVPEIDYMLTVMKRPFQ